MGFSERLRGRFRFDVWTDQLAGTLAVLGLERAIVIGQSLGGAVVTMFAGVHPEKVDRVISVDSGPWMNPAMIPMLIPRYVTWLVDRRGYWPNRPDQGDRYAERLRDVYRIEGTRRDLAAAIRGQFLDSRNYFRSIAAVACPTLLIHGGADRIIPPRAARSLLGRIKHSEMVVIEGAGHFAMQDAPERFADECERFLTSTSR
jgi:pimeloyl-ACP methyl ester carboxylesterase